MLQADEDAHSYAQRQQECHDDDDWQCRPPEMTVEVPEGPVMCRVLCEGDELRAADLVEQVFELLAFLSGERAFLAQDIPRFEKGALTGAVHRQSRAQPWNVTGLPS